jgi:hypothetical protein
VGAEELISTLKLDGLSFVSFGDRQVLLLPSGSQIKLHFSPPASDGSASFTIAPADVSIAPIPLDGGQTLQYSLASPASGSMRPTASGRRLDFNATIRATLSGGPNDGTFSYAMPFTTEQVAAPSADGTPGVSVTGMRLVDSVWYAQVVGATTNKDNAFPEPGAAVYTVLSGSFDRVP